MVGHWRSFEGASKGYSWLDVGEVRIAKVQLQSKARGAFATLRQRKHM